MNDIPDDLTQENLARHNEIFDQIDKDFEEDEQRRCWSDSKWFHDIDTSASNFLNSRDNTVRAGKKTSAGPASMSRAAPEFASERPPEPLSEASEDFLMASRKQAEVDIARLYISPKVTTKARKADPEASSATEVIPRTMTEQRSHEPQLVSQADVEILMASLKQAQADLERLQVAHGLQTAKTAGKNDRHTYPMEAPPQLGKEGQSRVGTWKGFERIPRERAGGTGLKPRKSGVGERIGDDKCVVC